MSALVLLAALSLQTQATYAVEGRVTDESGTPMPGVLVTMLGPGIEGRSAKLADADGRFEWDGLASGRYRLTAEGRGYFTETSQVVMLTVDQPRQKVHVVVTHGAVIAGFVTDEFGDAIPNLTVELSRASRQFRTTVTDDRGYYRFWSLPAGRYYASARLDPIDALRTPQDELPAATYFPGVTLRARAEPIVVAAGAELEGLNFTTKHARYAALSISVVDAAGKPANGAEVAVTAIGSDRPVPAHATAPGRFFVARLAPDDYEVTAIQRGSLGLEYASERVSMPGDSANLSMTLSTSGIATLSGRVIVERPAALPSGLAIATDTNHVAFSARVGSDGRFTVPAPPGRRLIQVRNLPPGWAPLSVLVNGVDEIDRPLAFVGDRSIDRVEIAVGDRLGTVTGTIAGGHLDDPPLAVFLSRDRSRWNRGTRSILTAVADADGRFHITGVRPGEYLAAAMPGSGLDSLGEPWFLSALADRALPVSIVAGDQPSAIALTLPGR